MPRENRVRFLQSESLLLSYHASSYRFLIVRVLGINALGEITAFNYGHEYEMYETRLIEQVNRTSISRQRLKQVVIS